MRARCLLIWPAALLLLLCAAGRAEACSCMEAGPPCQAYGSASAVFAGTVAAISNVETKEGDADAAWGKRVIRFSSVEAFRGVSGREVEVRTGSGGGDCGYPFTRGERYLVYAYKAGPNNSSPYLYASICSRTRPISDAAEDLEHIRTMERATPGVTISGEAQRYSQSRPNDPSQHVGPVAGATVTVEGEGGRFETRTDAQGSFRLAGLPAGKYKVRLALPDDLATYDAGIDREIADRGCAVVVFHVYDNGRVSGRLTDAQGQPVSQAVIDLIAAEDADAELPRTLYAESDDEGLYEFRMVPPGRYLLGLRIHGAPLPDNVSATYPPTYYPGVADASEATVISVAPGQKLQKYDLRLPPRLPERTLGGTVTFADGRPAARADISFQETSYGIGAASFGVTADERGRFSFKAREGLSYLVKAYLTLSDGTGRQMHAEPVEATAGGAAGEIRLVISEPGGSCERCLNRARRVAKPSRS